MRRPRRGVSAGTVVMLALTAAVLLGTGLLLARLSGGIVPDMRAGREALPLPEGLKPLETQDIPLQQAVPAPTATRMPQAAPPAGLVQLFPYATEETAPARTEMTAGGIVALEKAVRQSGYYAEVQDWDLTDVFSLLSREMTDSLSLVTLENLVVPGAAVSDLIAPEEVMRMLSAGGVDMAAIGFARMWEYGFDGLNSTLLAAGSAGVETLGVARTEAEAGPEAAVLTLDGIRVGLIHVVDGLTTKSGSALKKDGRTWTVLQAADATAYISALRGAGAECVVVSIHWGSEGKTAPTNAQKRLAQQLADAGADVILGAGARRVQPVVWLDAADGRKTLCAYDLGCLVSDSRNAGAVAGMLLRFALVKSGSGVHVEDVQCCPTYLWKYTMDGMAAYRVLAADEPAPEGMSQADQQAMEKAAEKVHGIVSGF